jgi:hypothetical protein
MAKNENIEISFLGMKFKCTNPTPNGMIVIILLLIFFVALVILLPKLSIIKLLSG